MKLALSRFLVTALAAGCTSGSPVDPTPEVPGSRDAMGEVSTWEGEWFRPHSTLPDDELVPTIIPADGRALIVYEQNGGRTVVGEVYDPATNTATRMTPSGLIWRANSAIVWSGDQLLIAGGGNGPGIDRIAAAFDPSSMVWRDLPDPPGPVAGPAVWTGSELLAFTSRLALDPSTDAWRTTAEMPGPGRVFPAVVWTGAELVVWGGCDAAIPQCDDFGLGALGTGARYDPERDGWRPMSPGPLAHGFHPKAIWTGSEMFVYAGLASPRDGAMAAVYDPSTDSWRRLPDPPLPPRRYAGTAWTGRYFVIWGGEPLGLDGAAFDTVTEEWLLLPSPPAGSERDRHAMAWIGDQLHIIGGWDTNGALAFRPSG